MIDVSKATSTSVHQALAQVLGENVDTYLRGKMYLLDLSITCWTVHASTFQALWSTLEIGD